jgi:hypothetical protein
LWRFRYRRCQTLVLSKYGVVSGRFVCGDSMRGFCVAAAMGVACFSPAFAQNDNTYAVGRAFVAKPSDTAELKH